MRKPSLKSWKTLVPLAILATGLTVGISASFAADKAAAVRVAIMTDCKGAFGFGYELDIGGAQAAFAQFAGGKTKSTAKPSAGTGDRDSHAQASVELARRSPYWRSYQASQSRDFAWRHQASLARYQSTVSRSP